MSTTESDSPHIKGAAFREFLQWYAEQQGLGRLVEHVEALPEADRGEFEAGAPALGVTASRWYPASTVHRLLDEIVRARNASTVTIVRSQVADLAADLRSNSLADGDAETQAIARALEESPIFTVSASILIW